MTPDEIRAAAHVMVSSQDPTTFLVPDASAIASVLRMVQERGVDLSPLTPDPSQRYTVERRVPGNKATPFWFVHDEWTGDPVLSISEVTSVDAEAYAHDMAERLNAS